MLITFATIQHKENCIRLGALYEEHASWMYKVAYRILNDNQLAQDAVQEAFINISNNFERIIGTDSNKIRALFVIIVRNVAIDIYRQRKKHCSLSIEEIEEDLSESGSSVEEILVNNEAFARVAEKIKELHTPYADILSLKFFYHYEDEEIARILNITPQNIRTRLHRARKSLIKLLTQEEEATNNE